MVMKMKKKIELPLIEPLYSTYHGQAPATSIIVNNPSIRNFYLNEALVLKCSRKFLSGFTTPEVDINRSDFFCCPYFDRKFFSMRHLKRCTNAVIRELLNDGYYVYFGNVDDYYIKGKSWYKERHAPHDGLICGYNQEDKTFCMYAYDQNWICQKFWTPQKSFDAARKSMFKQCIFGNIWAVKPKSDPVEFNVRTALNNMRQHLGSSMRSYPKKGEGNVFGMAVHDYIAMYIDKLYNGSVPYERKDRRIFRLIWEHKKTMLECMEKIEAILNLDHKSSSAYKEIAREADNIRMLYASYIMRRRDSVLPIIRAKLINIKNRERVLLKRFVKKAEAVISK